MGPESTVLDCEHPYVPTRPGERRTYRLQVTPATGPATGGSIELRATSGARLDDGRWATRWEVRLAIDGVPEVVTRYAVRCGRSEDGEVEAEEPWYMSPMPQLGIARGWAWPATLSPGREFGGRALITATDTGRTLGSEDRRLVVREEETVEVPAGTFTATRVSYETNSAVGAERYPQTGTLWVARGVGLVRDESRNASQSSTWELESLAGP